MIAGPIHPTYGTDPRDEDIGDMAVLVLAEAAAIAPIRTTGSRSPRTSSGSQ
ncbi:MAG TPA: hypothetical protein VFU21_20670 [Kofleriaceae bacterium]|nr:hypothetical protein [Kofleriaceae bacterium]